MKRLVFVLVAGICSGATLFAAGFSIFEQGSKAMGMGGAFTAQADDPSAMFHNVGGLAFLEGGWAAGLTLISPDSSFSGADPFPGVNSRGSIKNEIFFPPHFYWVKPIGDKWTFGFSLNSPFGLAFRWDNVDSWAGRFISYESEIRSFDMGLNLGWKVSSNFGLGFGFITRFSDVLLKNRLSTVNPFTFQVVDVADASLSSDFATGFGFTFGLLSKIGDKFSIGFSYRSPIDIKYEGTLLLNQISTGNAELDQVVANTLPFNTPIGGTATIGFPAMASLGFAFSFSPTFLMEIDINWTGWSTFDRLVIDLDDSFGLPDKIRNTGWSDVYNYRLGFRIGEETSQWRFGIYTDESPQPARDVGPILADADRMGYSVGYGRKGDRLGWDIALLFVDFKGRSVLTEQEDGFFGSYSSDAWLLGFTFNM